METKRPLVLIVCDGWGYSENSFGNAIAAASTPNFDALCQRWPWTKLEASGKAVGLPSGQQGNSEVGHLTIGSGRVILQPLSRINHELETGEFYSNRVLKETMSMVAQENRTVHCLGLLSPGGVHSDQLHVVGLARLAKQCGVEQLAFHVFTDGRDVAPTSALENIKDFQKQIEAVGIGRIASISGRFYAMDRDHRWERTVRAYDAITNGPSKEITEILQYIANQYEANITDEFIEPAAVIYNGKRLHIAEHDVVIFFNFRPDRARQLCHALVDQDFIGFTRTNWPHPIELVTFAEYEKDLPAAIVFPVDDVAGTIAEIVSQQGLSQIHIAETEKYAHVTYFFNGGREEPFTNEARLLIPSPKVRTYDEAPAMSAELITQALISEVKSGERDLIVANFANPDMVGHTGNFTATQKAVEIVDTCLGRIAQEVLAIGGVLAITADHGNAELKINAQDNSPLTAHTTNPVPFLLCGTSIKALQPAGALADIVPTLLPIMGWPFSSLITGKNLAI